MSELKDHLFFLLANNISYNSACDALETHTSSLPPPATGTPSDGIGSFDEDFIIDLLISTNLPFVIFGACFCLSAEGTISALPALLCVRETATAATHTELTAAIDHICARAGINEAQLRVLADKSFRSILWNKSGMAFLCVFSVLVYSLDLDIDEPTTEAFGDFLIAELAVDMEGFDSIHAFRLCHENTPAFFDEMRRYDKTWRSEVLLTEALVGAHIAESRESRLNTLYQELMNEFLNVRLLQVFGREYFRR